MKKKKWDTEFVSDKKRKWCRAVWWINQCADTRKQYFYLIESKLEQVKTKRREHREGEAKKKWSLIRGKHHQKIKFNNLIWKSRLPFFPQIIICLLMYLLKKVVEKSNLYGEKMVEHFKLMKNRLKPFWD